MPNIADKYLQQILNTELPNGLKITWRSSSVQEFNSKMLIDTTRWWLHRKRFCYMEHKNSLFFVGHKCPNVVQNWQSVFIWLLDTICRSIVEYKIGFVATADQKVSEHSVEHWTVLCAPNEMRCQAHDGMKKSLAFEGTQALRNKRARPRASPQWCCLHYCWMAQPWNTAKIVMAIGPVICLWSRFAKYITDVHTF